MFIGMRKNWRLFITKKPEKKRNVLSFEFTKLSGKKLEMSLRQKPIDVVTTHLTKRYGCKNILTELQQAFFFSPGYMAIFTLLCYFLSNFPCFFLSTVL